MSLLEFNQLDKAEQVELIWKATLITNFIEEPKRYILYQFDNFYIELLHHLQSNVPNGISAFDEPDELVPYQDQLKSY